MLEPGPIPEFSAANAIPGCVVGVTAFVTGEPLPDPSGPSEPKGEVAAPTTS